MHTKVIKSKRLDKYANQLKEKGVDVYIDEKELIIKTGVKLRLSIEETYLGHTYYLLEVQKPPFKVETHRLRSVADTMNIIKEEINE